MVRFAQADCVNYLSIDDNEVTRNRDMTVLGFGAIAIATATLAIFSVLLHKTDARERQTPVF
ncbi:hypothetical protein HPDFL43_00145 [Hoeflea phototrophica DFL-43]|uniref:Uncharacterized protein n=1 Tax=Hoeflea phototrophica (strain DSM 17068 / NCIMB 14078 / DFL-43) TaxID=411684 RepID=A9CYE0_HOEPD|nr:hypothetical protein HPDFL43_00145 [Hoeflea phototrophica DFL-43]